MKNANEMLEILVNELEHQNITFERYNAKYVETGRESWYQRANEVNGKIIVLERLYEQFTGKKYGGLENDF